jgi:hypothetical protein
MKWAIIASINFHPLIHWRRYAKDFVDVNEELRREDKSTQASVGNRMIGIVI